MAELDAAVLNPSGGYIFVAPTDSAKPDFDIEGFDPRDPGDPWESVGHTALEELPSLEREGDDPTTLGSWQNRKLRVTSPDVTYSVVFRSIQSTTLTYQMYFGAGAGATQADGSFRIPAAPIPQEHALLLIVVDGENFLPMYHPRVSLLGSDAVGMDAEGWITYPIRGTFLGSSALGGAIGEWAALGVVPSP